MLYAIFASYFAGVMVRLMLTLTPIVCVLAAIAFSKTFELYLKDDTPKSAQKEGEESPENKNERLYDKVDKVREIYAYYPRILYEFCTIPNKLWMPTHYCTVDKSTS